MIVKQSTMIKKVITACLGKQEGYFTEILRKGKPKGSETPSNCEGWRAAVQRPLVIHLNKDFSPSNSAHPYSIPWQPRDTTQHRTAQSPPRRPSTEVLPWWHWSPNPGTNPAPDRVIREFGWQPCAQLPPKPRSWGGRAEHRSPHQAPDCSPGCAPQAEEGGGHTRALKPASSVPEDGSGLMLHSPLLLALCRHCHRNRCSANLSSPVPSDAVSKPKFIWDRSKCSWETWAVTLNCQENNLMGEVPRERSRKSWKGN